MNKLILLCKDIYHQILILLFKPLPIQRNKIVFNSYYGRGYSDNQKYIADEILRRKLPYDLVWLLKDMDEPMPQGIRKVKYNRIRCDYELATAKIILSNTKGDLHFRKKKSQYYIQTWHGSFGLKYIEGDAERTLSKRYIDKSKKDSAQTDLFISNSRLQSEEYRRALWCNCEIMECGFPRNDIFFENRDKDAIKRKIGITPSCRVVLYAPTFRDNKDFSCFQIDCKSVLKTLCSKTGDDWVMLMRLHPSIRNKQGVFREDNNIIDVTKYNDAQELLFVSDALISDYSSTMLDFVIQRRPIFIFATDIGEYKKMRGLKPMYFELPFDICTSNDELAISIANFDEEQYQKKLDDFFKLYSPYDRGTASESIVEKIRSYVNEC